MRENIARSAEDPARAEAERLRAEPFVSGLESTAPGAMSSLAAAQYASEMDRIGKTYSGIREASLRSLGARGFGRAPSGFTTSAVNTAAEQQGRTETDAYRQGLARTYEQGLQALAYRTGQQQLGLGVSNQEQEQASLAAARRAQMGSGVGDVLGGISGVAGAVVPWIPKRKTPSPYAPTGPADWA